MSLASRVANFLSPGVSAQEGDSKSFRPVDDGLPRGTGSYSGVRLGAEVFNSTNMAPEAIEEEDRPPYLHVWFSMGTRRPVC